MVNLNKLRGLMAESGVSQKELSKAIGISERVMCNRMKTGSFTVGEATAIVKTLHIENPSAIFFADAVN